jgi:phage terminase small subunit
MPRRSAASLAIARIDPASTRLRPPRELGEEECEVWSNIVGSVADKHFERSDTPLLVRYCQNVVLARRAAAALAAEGPIIAGRASAWLIVAEKCDRALVALAMRLRLSPQARRETPKAGKMAGVSAYEMLQDD